MLTYLNDMRDALRMALVYAYVVAKENHSRVPSPIALRRRLRTEEATNAPNENVYTKIHV